jgi:hypothetical protein
MLPHRRQPPHFLRFHTPDPPVQALVNASSDLPIHPVCLLAVHLDAPEAVSCPKVWPVPPVDGPAPENGANRLVEFAFALAVLGLVEELVEGRAVKVLAAEEDGLDLRSVVNIGEGIGAEEDEVGAMAGGDEAKIFSTAKEFGGAEGGGLQRGQWREAGLDEQNEFIVKTEAREAERVHGIGAREERNAGAEHDAD